MSAALPESFSLNETSVLAERATRGAGYSWGLAQEAGQAVSWLSRHGFNGCHILATLLRAKNVSQTPLPQLIVDRQWQTKGADICPLILGSGLVDRAYMLFEGGILTAHNVRAPELLFPFVTWASRMLHAGVTMEWNGLKLVTNGVETSINATPKALGLEHVDEVRFWPGGVPEENLPQYWRVRPDPEAMATLKQFAARIYAPVTEGSRLLDAGAGLNDND